jgi:hypothetical protein
MFIGGGGATAPTPAAPEPLFPPAPAPDVALLAACCAVLAFDVELSDTVSGEHAISASTAPSHKTFAFGIVSLRRPTAHA